MTDPSPRDKAPKPAPDSLLFDLTPNPPPPNPLPEGKKVIRAEEERRLRAIRLITELLAKPIDGLHVRETGEIDPATVPNPERAEAIVEKAQPKIAEFTSLQGGSITIGEIRLPDGTVMKDIAVRGRSIRKFAFTLGELGELISKLSEIVEHGPAFVIGIAARVFVAADEATRLPRRK